MAATEVKIPKGWRQIKVGEILRDKDCLWYPSAKKWEETMYGGYPLDCVVVPYIRRLSPTPKQAKTCIHNPEGAVDAHDFNCAIEGSGKCNCSQKRPKQVKAKGKAVKHGK